jgi:MerR family mercuric resistance operon transcriptional regulator
MSIGQLSELTGVNIETIRYYEKIGLLPPASRAANDRRVYRAVEHRILAFVRRSRELGFSLNDIRALLRLGGPRQGVMPRGARDRGPSSRPDSRQDR